MNIVDFPNLNSREEVVSALRGEGFALVPHKLVLDLIEATQDDANQLNDFWNNLPEDQYLKDRSKYRRRKHASLEVVDSKIQIKKHRAHWQPTTYNALHGGIQRWFEPIDSNFLLAMPFRKLLTQVTSLASEIDHCTHWFSEIHQFRIDTTDGIGRPTPEGAHRDGVDWVALLLIEKSMVVGGETRVFQINNTLGRRFTLDHPWTLLMMDDRRVVHETSPIRPKSEYGWRDTLVITLRSSGFLDEPEHKKILDLAPML